MTRRAAAGLALALCATAPAAADPPRLSLPLDCTPGRTCVIEDYVDADPGPGAHDHACGLKTRDGHRGTDFMLRSFTAMRAGVDVRAAAPGTVAATRDGMADRPVSPETRPALAGRRGPIAAMSGSGAATRSSPPATPISPCGPEHPATASSASTRSAGSAPAPRGCRRD